MVDKRIKMDCPFCGHSKDDIQIKQLTKNGYVSIYCPQCNVQFVGSSKQDLIDKWNRRV